MLRVFAAVYGLIFGSLYNVCIYRIPLGLSIVRPRSHCFACGMQVAWIDNIPLLSYLLLGGRCRHCKTRFSVRYFLVEALTALLFVLVFETFRLSWATPFYIAFASLLMIASFTDLDHWIIPDGVSWGGLVLGLIFALTPFAHEPASRIAYAGPFEGGSYFTPFYNAAVGAAFGYLILWFIGIVGTAVFHKEAMGMGDMKLFAFVGSFLGMLNCVFALGIACVVGASVGLTLIAIAKWSKRGRQKEIAGDETVESLLPASARREGDTLAAQEAETLRTLLKKPVAPPPTRHHLPFGPFLALGALIVLLYERELSALVMQRFSF
ncbi:MAG: prepilin peptidase [bacterium]